jgi:hypothetical protein
VTAKGLQEGLEAARDDAPQHLPVDHDLADARRPLDAADRRHADEADLNSLHHRPFRHDRDATGFADGSASGEFLTRYLAGFHRRHATRIGTSARAVESG